MTAATLDPVKLLSIDTVTLDGKPAVKAPQSL